MSTTVCFFFLFSYVCGVFCVSFLLMAPLQNKVYNAGTKHAIAITIQGTGVVRRSVQRYRYQMRLISQSIAFIVSASTVHRSCGNGESMGRPHNVGRTWKTAKCVFGDAFDTVFSALQVYHNNCTSNGSSFFGWYFVNKVRHEAVETDPFKARQQPCIRDV